MTINHPLATDYATEQPPARMVAGALAHLATHMSTGCPRAAMLAAMLLERVATDPDADSHLRSHARELVEILERDPQTSATASSPMQERQAASRQYPLT
ncbi:hypothetical protein [Sulfuritalea hydrogenivorans]|jgi:hypothetical protein|uniref:Uncharacterized protein n=1 Tax=Sulfuritalea hydrogenivorans sk43H TaxID=1223802 RepID=W0SD29_9PROT|nr:hypothetical protein [Sulfuritalea hydrogenivorans]MDK9715972.1 hypothetical protein [Sulfuritalea sp.]BAO28670.1 hypothetical protein SUTH_00863 [Sulfuritalea hydrogenivorans sk43H]